MPDVHEEQLDYRGTLARLDALKGQVLLLESRVGGLHGPFRLAARGPLAGAPKGQDDLSARRAPGDDLHAFILEPGGFFTVAEADFVRGGWWPGGDDGHPSQPHLNIEFDDSALHIAVIGKDDDALSRLGLT